MKSYLMAFMISLRVSLTYGFAEVVKSFSSYSTSACRLRHLYSNIESDDRFIANSERVLEQCRAEMNVPGKERCSKCWFYKSVCLCDKVRELAAGAEPCKTEMHLFMHYKEFGKTSNTVKLGFPVVLSFYFCTLTTQVFVSMS